MIKIGGTAVAAILILAASLVAWAESLSIGFLTILSEH